MVYILAAVLAVLMIIVCVGRPETLPDYSMYQYLYDIGSVNIRRDIEYSYKLLADLSPTFIFLLSIYAVLSVGTHVYAIFRNSPNIWISFAAYLAFYFVLHDMVQMRAGVATGLLLIALRCIQERKMLVYMLLVVLAGFFHSSAYLFLPLYFVPYKHINKWVWASILLVALAMGITNNAIGFVAKLIPVKFIEGYVSSYVGAHEHTASTIGLISVFKVLCTIFMIFNLSTIKKHYPLAVPVMVFCVLAQVSYMVFADIPVMQSRLGELFGVFEIFGYAMLPLISKKHYYLLVVLALFLSFLKFPTTLQLIAG